MALGGGFQRCDLVRHRDRDDVAQDRALPGAAAIGRAAAVGADHDEPGVGVKLVHHVRVE